MLTAFAGDQPQDGPLVLPTARGIRLTFTAVGRDTPDYFASDAARRGEPVPLECRADAIAEDQDTLLIDPDGVPAVRSFYFQPPPDDASVPRPAERLGPGSGARSHGAAAVGSQRTPHGDRLFGGAAARAVAR